MHKGIVRIVLFLAVVIGAAALLQGCANMFNAPPQAGAAGAPAAPVPKFANDFQDIEIPPELKQDNENSLVVKTDSFRGGVLQYTGHVDADSLGDFMKAAMSNNGWKPVGEALYKDSMLVFIKPDQSCIIIIKKNALGKTRMILYLAYDLNATGAVNPFGDRIVE